MDSTRSYRRLALHCIELAEAVDDPTTQGRVGSVGRGLHDIGGTG